MFVDIKGEVTIYQGNSFYKGIEKSSGNTWSADDSGYWEIIDMNGNQVATHILEKSSDSKRLIAKVKSQDTQELFGRYRLLIVLTSLSDSGVDDTLADYELNIIKRRA